MISEIVKDSIESMPVLIICPVCNDSTFAVNLQTLDETIHRMWQLSTKCMNEFFGIQETSSALATAGMQNRKEDQIKKILHQGHLKIMCRVCMTNFSEKQYKEQGMHILRIGNMLFETLWYNKNRKEIKDHIKKNPDIYKRTFWT